MTPAAPTILIADDDDNDIASSSRTRLQANPNPQPPPPRPLAGEETIAYLRGDACEFSDRQEHPLPCFLYPRFENAPSKRLRSRRLDPSATRPQALYIAILTSSREEPDINHAYDLRANTYLVKPVKFGRTRRGPSGPSTTSGDHLAKLPDIKTPICGPTHPCS